MRLMNTKRSISGGEGGNFFKLGEGQTATVRFLYDTVDNVLEDGVVVHVIPRETTGQKYNTEVLCGAKTDETANEDCKWCRDGYKSYGRYPLVLFNEDKGRIEYWSRTQMWVNNTLIPVFENSIQQGEPISGKMFKIIRSGSGTSTQYTILPDGRSNDGKKPEDFGEIVPAENRNVYRPADYIFPVVTDNGMNFQNNNNAFHSTRRTTDVF